jgi:hypothetical protein
MRSSLLCMLCKSVDFKGLTAFKSSPLMNTDFTDLNKAKKHLPRISAGARGSISCSHSDSARRSSIRLADLLCVPSCPLWLNPRAFPIPAMRCDHGDLGDLGDFAALPFPVHPKI